MGRVIVISFATLDGVVDDPDGSGGTPHGGWAFRFGPEATAGDKFLLGDVLDTGVMVYGRATWQLFARIFGPRDDPFSRRMTAVGKVVASRTLPDASGWANSTLLTGDLVDEVARLAAARDVVVAGSGSVVDRLVAADAVDQYRLLVFPLALGEGRRLFDAAAAPVALELASSEDTGRGVLRQVYNRPARAEES